MELSRKKMIPAVILVSLFFHLASFAIDFKMPKDPGTLEALIDAHKQMKKAEDMALAQIETNVIEQSVISKTTKLYNETKSLINQKMSDANSYLLLASSIVQLTGQFKKAVEEYSDFGKRSFDSAKSHPLAPAFFANANYKITKEVQHATKLIGSYFTQNLNILKASNDEKVKMLFLIQASVSNIRNIIYHADLMMRSMIKWGYKHYYIWEILTDDVLRDISRALIKNWNKQ